MVGLLSLAGLLACSLPVQTFGAKKTDLTLRFLVLGGQAGSRSLDSRLLLPTAKTITVTLEPEIAGSNLSTPEPVTNDLESNLVAVRFPNIVYGRYVVAAEAFDADGKLTFQQSAPIEVKDIETPKILNLVPVEFDGTSLDSTTNAQAVSDTLGPGEARTWQVPAGALVDKTYRLNMDLLFTEDLTMYAQKLDGTLRNDENTAAFVQAVDIGASAASYLTLYNSGNSTLQIRFVINGLGITYDANGATSGTIPVDPDVYVEDDAVPVKGNDGTLVKTGYTFAGWNTQADGGGDPYVSGSEYTMGTANVTLWAQWTANTYTVTFDANGASGTPPIIVSYTFGTSLNLPGAGDLVKIAANFAGWNTQANGLGTNFPAGSPLTMGAADLTLYATWTDKSVYTVTFDPQGGNTVGSQSIVAGEFAFSPTAPTRTGYSLVGWYRESAGTTAWDFAIDTVASDVTLYAKWNIDIYTISYSLDGGTNSGSNPAIYTVTTPTITLVAPSRMGYSFSGWYADAGFTTAAAPIVVGSTGLRMFYARWTAESYTITYILDGGMNDNGNPESYTIETPSITLLPPNQNGYTFGGWYNESDLTTLVTQILTGSTGMRTLYAQWVTAPVVTISLIDPALPVVTFDGDTITLNRTTAETMTVTASGGTNSDYLWNLDGNASHAALGSNGTNTIIVTGGASLSLSVHQLVLFFKDSAGVDHSAGFSFQVIE